LRPSQPHTSSPDSVVHPPGRGEHVPSHIAIGESSTQVPTGGRRIASTVGGRWRWGRDWASMRDPVDTAGGSEEASAPALAPTSAPAPVPGWVLPWMRPGRATAPSPSSERAHRGSGPASPASFALASRPLTPRLSLEDVQRFGQSYSPYPSRTQEPLDVT